MRDHSSTKAICKHAWLNISELYKVRFKLVWIQVLM